jgi:ABC-2 type transport system ATP-binding protein
MTNEHKEFWSRIAENYDAVVELQLGPNTRTMIRDRLVREENLGAVVEFGCGTGFFTEALASKATSVLATDLAPGMLNVARRCTSSNNVRFQLEDCQNTSLPKSSFDTVFMSLVIHFTLATKTLAEMHRILRPGGTLIIANGDPGALGRWNRSRWWIRGLYYGVTHHRTKPPKGFAKGLLTEKQLCSLLQSAQFTVACSETFRNMSSLCNLPVEYIKARKI